MKGIMFFDDDLKEVKLPEVNKEAWDDFMSKVEYAFFDIPERLAWFKETYRQFDNYDGLFDKDITGAYILEDDYWYLLKDEELRGYILEAYIRNTMFPLEGGDK